MGLFGGIFKAVKKVAGTVARVAASKLTGGVSDVVLKKLKAIGDAKKVAQLTAQRQALVNKAAEGLGAPRVSTAATLRNAAGYYGRDGGLYTGPESSNGSVPRKRMPGRPKVASRPPSPPVRTAKKSKKTMRLEREPAKAPAAFAGRAQKMKDLAAEWRRLGGKEGTGETFFDWKRGR